MANHLDLEEQEQLDSIKHFWKQYGNLITWALIAVLAMFACWNFYQYWQRGQASQAAAMHDEVERLIQAGDISKVDRAFADMQDKFPGTTYAQQAALLVAKVNFEAGKTDAAKSALTWVAEKSADDGLQSIAKLRLAGILIDTKAFDDAFKLLSGVYPGHFQALADDRKGDIFVLQGKRAEAKSAYESAYKGSEERTEYRRLIEVKLNALGAGVPSLDLGGAK
ncbi:MAG: hypothetical protein RIS34_1264 [Pseudomonadota bacterium]|jgi:predicted negative regulator of RcsB-dependent stress response